MNSYQFWRLVWFDVQWLFIILYIVSVLAFLGTLKRRRWRVPVYFSDLFFLALCPFFILFFNVVFRLWDIFHHIDAIANAQEILAHAVQPLYLGMGTSLILVISYSLLYVRHRTHSAT